MNISTKLLTDLCALPTAAFLEDAVIDYVEAWAKKRSDVKVMTDGFGNRLLQVGKGRKPRLVLVAHVDHPSFVMMDDGYAEFRGGVFAECVGKTKVRFYTPGGEVLAIPKNIHASKSGRLEAINFTFRGDIPRGSIGMWEVGGKAGAPNVKGDRFSCRVCDDLAGVASALTALDILRRDKLDQPVCVLLTRAEEVGLLGAIYAAKDTSSRKLLRETDRVISIETSAIQPAAQQGKGVVLRVGDRVSIFHSAFMHFLFKLGQSLTEKDQRKKDGFVFQRSLMPGGACEGTCFDAYGYVTAAACVALGNYPNMDRDKKKMGPEYVSVRDWKHMVRLFVETGRHLGDFSGEHDVLRKKLDENLSKAMPLV
ncbi:MAG: M28 family peptidase, partial [Planctomycetota bacterium]